MMAAAKQINQTVIRGRTPSARNRRMARNRTVTGFLRPYVPVGVRIQDNVLLDPAVGSGAFPLGMLNEIVRARENISAYMAIPMNGEQRKFMYSNTRSLYSLKRTTIQNCIFAADIIKYERTVKKSILASPYALDIIFSDAISLIAKMEDVGDKLGNHYTCENACATSDCYTLKTILKSLESEDEYNKSYYKVINTGTIGRYVSRWGKTSMRYLKDKYDYPVATVAEFRNTFPNSYGDKAAKRKIIIKGLTLLDASIDVDGSYIPGKSTEIVACDNIDDLKVLCAYINSKVAIFYIKQKYSSSSYNGGINFTKNMINDLPWVSISDEEKNRLIEVVDKIISLKTDDIEADTVGLEKEIDQFFIKKFDFNPNEAERILNS